MCLGHDFQGSDLVVFTGGTESVGYVMSGKFLNTESFIRGFCIQMKNVNNSSEWVSFACLGMRERVEFQHTIILLKNNI
jgi:hypothetical protein